MGIHGQLASLLRLALAETLEPEGGEAAAFVADQAAIDQPIDRNGRRHRDRQQQAALRQPTARQRWGVATDPPERRPADDDPQAGNHPQQRRQHGEEGEQPQEQSGHGQAAQGVILDEVGVLRGGEAEIVGAAFGHGCGKGYFRAGTGDVWSGPAGTPGAAAGGES